ncbi:deoxycytidylate deaminase [Patescibacteria group bacterium]|nr:deoxycytidylate deaminase [Patescibacteria group bacterium]
MKEIILAYVPVLHHGYRRFFEKHAKKVQILYIFGRELIQEFDHLSRKDIRALNPEDVALAIQSWCLFSEVHIADYKVLSDIQSAKLTVIMPDEDECHELSEKYLDRCHIKFDSVFLRWDKSRSLAQKKVNYDRIIPFEGFVSEMMFFAAKEAKKASNWWRQVGAVIVKDKKIILVGYNRQVPSPRMSYTEGDARSFFKKGLHIDLTTDMHAEARLISEAAMKGISLKDTDLFVTTFPCPPCAKIVAYSGIKRCYFNSGYAMLDGERILRSQGVEIIFVK